MQRNLSKRMWDIVTQQPGHVLLLPFLSQARRVWQLDGVFGLAVTPLGNLAESNVWMIPFPQFSWTCDLLRGIVFVERGRPLPYFQWSCIFTGLWGTAVRVHYTLGSSVVCGVLQGELNLSACLACWSFILHKLPPPPLSLSLFWRKDPTEELVYSTLSLPHSLFWRKGLTEELLCSSSVKLRTEHLLDYC